MNRGRLGLTMLRTLRQRLMASEDLELLDGALALLVPEVELLGTQRAREAEKKRRQRAGNSAARPPDGPGDNPGDGPGYSGNEPGNRPGDGPRESAGDNPPQTPRSGEDLSLSSSLYKEKEREAGAGSRARPGDSPGDATGNRSPGQSRTQRASGLLAAFERIVHGGKLSAGDDAPALAVLAGLLPVLDARAETPAAALALFEAVLVAYAAHKHERGLGVVLAFFCADFATWADRPGLATPRRTMSEPAAPLHEPEPEACPPELVEGLHAQLARMRNRTRCA